MIKISPHLDITMSNPMDEAKTKWLQEFLEQNLPLVANLTAESPNWQENASIFAANLEKTLCDRGLTEPTQQKNPRSQVANVLRGYHPHHPAIPYPYTLLSPDTYTQLNLEQVLKTDERQTKFFSGADAIALVEKATSLLDCDDPNEIAAGLAVLIGRRMSEILISTFEPCTTYSVLFSEPVKKDGLIPPMEIPTLIEADKVLEAIARLRDVWNIHDIKDSADSERQLKQAINKRYEDVPKAVRRHYSDLIPGREADNDSGEKLYTHVFRSVYAEIATYFYKPRSVPDHRFKAEIQGHFTLSEQGKVRSYTSRPHYDDYLIGDRTPNADGIKLSLPDVSTLSVFAPQTKYKDKDKDKDGQSHESNEKLTPVCPTTPLTNNALNPQDLMAMLAEQYKLAISANEDKYQAIIQGRDALIQEKDALIKDKDAHLSFLSDELKRVRQHSDQTSYPDLSQENKHLLAEINRLSQLVASLEAERDQALSTLAQLPPILAQFQTVLNPNEDSNIDKNVDKDITRKKVIVNSHFNQSSSRSQPDENKLVIIERAIDAVKTYNNDPHRTQRDKWYISNPVIAELIRASGFKISAKTLQDHLRDRGQDLEQHHTYHRLSSRHNVKHDLPISQFISLN